MPAGVLVCHLYGTHIYFRLSGSMAGGVCGLSWQEEEEGAKGGGSQSPDLLSSSQGEAGAGRRTLRSIVLGGSSLALCALCTTFWLYGGDKWRGAELEQKLLDGVIDSNGMSDITKNMRREFAKEDQELKNRLSVARLPRIHSGLGSSEMASYLNTDTTGGDRKQAAEYRLQMKYAKDDKDFHGSQLSASFGQSGDPLSALLLTKYRTSNAAKKSSSWFPMLYAVAGDTEGEDGDKSRGVRNDEYQAILQGANNAAAQLAFRNELKSDQDNSRGYMRKLERDFLQSQNNGLGFQSLLQLSRRWDRSQYPTYADTISTWADRRSSEGLSGNVPHLSRYLSSSLLSSDCIYSRVHSVKSLEARAPFQQLTLGIGSTGEGEEGGNAKDWILAMESDPNCKKVVEQIKQGILGALLDKSTDCLANKKQPKQMWPFGSPGPCQTYPKYLPDLVLGNEWKIQDQGAQDKSNLLVNDCRASCDLKIADFGGKKVGEREGKAKVG
eukprot:750597-Hanusia_phi.AAC.5